MVGPDTGASPLYPNVKPQYPLSERGGAGDSEGGIVERELLAMTRI